MKFDEFEKFKLPKPSNKKRGWKLCPITTSQCSSSTFCPSLDLPILGPLISRRRELERSQIGPRGLNTTARESTARDKWYYYAHPECIQVAILIYGLFGDWAQLSLLSFKDCGARLSVLLCWLQGPDMHEGCPCIESMTLCGSQMKIKEAWRGRLNWSKIFCISRLHNVYIRFWQSAR